MSRSSGVVFLIAFQVDILGTCMCQQFLSRCAEHIARMQENSRRENGFRKFHTRHILVVRISATA